MQNVEIEDGTVLISIVVAVYNQEKLLARCLDSLVYQSLQNLEIIVVNDHSEDRSLEVALQYEKWYPGKIKVFTNPGKGVSRAKNYGLSKCSGKYVTIVDSDDYVHLNGYAHVVKFAEENECGLVCTPYHAVSNGRKVLKSSSLYSDCLLSDEDRPRFIADEPPFLCTKIFSRSLYQEYGPLPSVPIGEDVGFILQLFTNVERIGMCNYPYYYYEYSQNSITLKIEDPRLSNHLNIVTDAMFNHCPSIYKKDVAFRAISRLYYFDVINRAHAAYQEVLDETLYGQRWLLDMIDEERAESKPVERMTAVCEAYPTRELIPTRVYVNGFTKENTPMNLEKVFENCENVSIVSLNAENCDITENQLVAEAYAIGNVDFVAGYFAVKSIYENGGIYIGPGVTVNQRFGQQRCDSAFFGRCGEQYTDLMFGGIKAQPIFQKMLETYSHPTMFEERFVPLYVRILCTLVGCEGIYQNGFPSKSLRGVRIYGTSTFVYAPDANGNVCTHGTWALEHLKVTKQLLLENEYTLRIQAVERQLRNANRKYGELRKHFLWVQNQWQNANQKYEKLSGHFLWVRDQLQNANQKYTSMETSRSFKIGRTITAAARVIRKPFRKHG